MTGKCMCHMSIAWHMHMDTLLCYTSTGRLMMLMMMLLGLTLTFISPAGWVIHDRCDH